MAFSQSGEEQVILDYFGNKVGTFLDIGSNDGITFSNTRALALKGWQGVMVEPSPKAYAKLKELYPTRGRGFYTYPYAIGSFNGKIMLHESGPLCNHNDVGLVSTLKPEEMERFKKTVKYEPVEVQVFKWKTFYNRLTIKEFDFVSIDVEGAELDFMPDMDFSKTSCVCVEFNGKEKLKKAYSEILEGFKIIYTSGENLIYAR